MFVKSLLMLCTAVAFCRSYKLLLFPIPASSHVFSFYYIGRELARRDHEVHMLVHWSYKLPKDWTGPSSDIVYHVYGNNSGQKFVMEEEAVKLNMDLLIHNLDMKHVFREMIRLNEAAVRDIFVGNEELMEHLESLKMDAAVIDYTFFMRTPVVLARRLKLPLISYTDTIEPWLMGMPWMPSIFTPLHPATDSRNTFLQRLSNTLGQIYVELVPPFKDPDDVVLDAYRKYESFVDLKDIVRKSVLFLTTEDLVLNVVRPYTANVVSVGGLTTEPLRTNERLSIPEDYLKFISDDNSGTVAVSFGSLVPRYPERLVNVFFQAFGKLPQYRFIWRFDNYLNLTIPKNVIIVKWLAQKELLSHSSVKLFITHSGNNGQFESLYLGVPMLCVPLLGDQPRNARRIVERGYGEEIDFRTMEVDQLISVILKVIEDPSYKRNIVKASEIFKSRPDSPGQRAAFWIEHVVRFGGEHLVPAGNDLNFWQYLCLDVLLLLEAAAVLATILFVFVVSKAFKYGRRLLSNSSKAKGFSKRSKSNKKEK